ncbi:hypothetical protein PG994_011622 [Apiospora phragmitis]|uniref:Uncharacterized protein n=1 Tax=Apiospora phragmitis TaxID=2905665 RepID=A0ABR1TTH1_9PEZI
MPTNKTTFKMSTDGIALGIATVAIAAVFLAATWCLVLGAKRWQDPCSAVLLPHNLNPMDLRELRGRILG